MYFPIRLMYWSICLDRVENPLFLQYLLYLRRFCFYSFYRLKMYSVQRVINFKKRRKSQRTRSEKCKRPCTTGVRFSARNRFTDRAL